MLITDGQTFGKEMMNVNAKLPENLEWYENQIAGHHPSVIRNGVRQIGIIKERGSKVVLKLKQEDIRGEREVAFYELCSTANRSERKERICELQRFLPRYYGQRTIRIDNKDFKFLQLEDIINTFKFPCIMDIKMGKVSYDPTASDEKKHNEALKCLCQPVFGFRVLGYRLNSELCGEPRTRDRVWGKSLTEQTIEPAFEEYLLRGRSNHLHEILFMFIGRLKEIRNWFEHQENLHFYASSLLLVYEGEGANETPEIKVDLKMIDFSHVFHVESGKDLNYIHGLDYLINTFDRIRTKH